MFWQEPNYPRPVAIKTKARCEYHLYTCRRMGKYVLDGQVFCGDHYDATWKWRHPVFGQQHDWQPRGLDKSWMVCRICSAVQVRQGIAQSPCRGGQARIILS
jgi:hypothetical protein